MGDSRPFIGQLADQLDMAPSALRYYEAAGLLAAEQRTESGYRVYGRRAADRLRFIRRATSLGLKLSEIKRIIDSPRGSREDERVFRAIPGLEDQRDAITDRGPTKRRAAAPQPRVELER